jgi:hypothetical protein
MSRKEAYDEAYKALIKYYNLTKSNNGKRFAQKAMSELKFAELNEDITKDKPLY